MLSSLSSNNVIQYLQEAGLCSTEDGASADSELPQSSKNRNFRVNLSGNRTLLVKQEESPHPSGAPHELFNEWLFSELLQKFPVLGNIPAIASSVQHYDGANAILVREYHLHYQQLGQFYRQKGVYHPRITTEIGSSLAALHRATYNSREYRNMLATSPQGAIRYRFYNPAQGIDAIAPDIFGNIPQSALKFYELYQKYDNLESAIADLSYEWKPSCVTHNDLRLENILVRSGTCDVDSKIVRFIDWEACSWGDPSYDLGTLVAEYLRIWLASVVIDPSLGWEESLDLAMIPLESLYPSLLNLVRSYLSAFPRILEYRRDFILRTLQFAGLVLIRQQQARLLSHRSFNRAGIVTLQLAKTLITQPQPSVKTVFGITEAELTAPLTQLQATPKPENKHNLLPIFYSKTRLRGC